MRKLVCCNAVLALLGVQAVSAQEVVQGPYGVNGTWNIYELVDEFVTWADALEEARSMTREGVAGDLASIHSLEENQLITDLAFNDIVWVGSTDREGAAPLREQNGHLSPQESIQLELEDFLGAENVEEAKYAGWAWTSGEPFCFQNWAGGEPNNWDGTAAGPADTGFEDATFIRADGLWNDAPSGYPENEPVVPTLQPDTSIEERDGLPNVREYRFVVEYRTNSAAPFPGIDEVGEDPFYDPPDCQPTLTTEPGDFDGDGQLGLGDINLLLAEVAAGTNDQAFDMTGDNMVNYADIQFYVGDSSFLNTYIGDANLDGEFNSSDFVQVFQANLFETGQPAQWQSGDWNGDGVFGSGDFVVAFQGSGFEMGPKAPPAGVPEPSGIVLALLGAMSAIGLRRRM